MSGNVRQSEGFDVLTLPGAARDQVAVMQRIEARIAMDSGLEKAKGFGHFIWPIQGETLGLVEQNSGCLWSRPFDHAPEKAYQADDSKHGSCHQHPHRFIGRGASKGTGNIRTE